MTMIEHDGYTDRITILDNGVTVATRELDTNRFQPNRCIYAATVKAGARHDEEQRGIAHFVEHLLYGEKIADQWLQYFRENGYQGQMPNASTSGEVTAYSLRGVKGTSIHKDDFVEAFSLQLRNIIELDFSSVTVSNERNRILREVRGYHDQYDFRRGLEFASFLHPGYLPNTLGGSEEQIQAITTAELASFYQQRYVGSNLLVPVCYPKGNAITHSMIVDLVDFHFGCLPLGMQAEQLPDAPFSAVEKRFIAEQKASDRDVDVYLYFPGRKYFEGPAYVKDAFLSLFWDGFGEAVHKAGLSYHMNSHDFDLDSQRTYGIGFTAPKEGANRVLELIVLQFQALATGNVADALEARKFSKRKDLSISELHSSTDFAFYTLHQGLLAVDRPATMDHSMVNSELVTADQLRQFAREAIHSPIAMKMEGDTDGKYVMSLSSFTSQLRQGIPSPERSLDQILANRQKISVEKYQNF